MQKKNEIKRSFVELNRKGLRILCRIMWRSVSPVVQKKFARWGVKDEDFDLLLKEGPLSEEMKAVRSSFESFFKHSNYTDSMSKDDCLKEASLTYCKMGGEAEMADVEYYFQMRLQDAEKQLKDIQAIKADSPPRWLVMQVKRLVVQLQRLKELKAPDILIQNSIAQIGEAHLTFEERIAFNLQKRTVDLEYVVKCEKTILEAHKAGDFAPAIIYLGEELEMSAALIEDEKIPCPDDEGNSIDTALFEADVYLCKSLLRVLHPIVGRA